MSLVSLDVICPVMALASFGIQATLHGLLNLGFKWRCHKRRCLDLSFWQEICPRELKKLVATVDVMHTTASFLDRQGSHEWLKKSDRHIGSQTGAEAPWTFRVEDINTLTRSPEYGEYLETSSHRSRESGWQCPWQLMWLHWQPQAVHTGQSSHWNPPHITWGNSRNSTANTDANGHSGAWETNWPVSRWS